MGADAVIYQTLEDLQAACAELSPRGAANQVFEVGVFCGRYITPIDEDYLDHLEDVRSEAQKFKVRERARQAALREPGHINGAATPNQVLSSSATVNGDLSPLINGRDDEPSAAMAPEDDVGVQSQENEGQVRDRMDINLHNFGDYSELGS